MLTSRVFKTWEALPSREYDIVALDPPWDYTASHHTNQLKYATMTQAELAQLDVMRLFRQPKKAVLFVWATCPKLHFAIDMIRAWGFEYQGMPYLWLKTRQDGVPWGARGVRPRLVKPVVEMVLAATHPQLRSRPLKLFTEKQRQVIAASPSKVHSEKPEEAYLRMEELFGPDVRRLEGFARRTRPGWDAFGDQVEAV